MANNITPKLKAYVQIDGTGRVVSGTPVFRTSKPKNGTWREIPLYYRGDSSTTTTTTNGGVTPTAFIQSYYLNVTNACNSTTDGNLLFYSASTTIQAGITVFTDAALTTPVTEGYVILTQPQPMQYVKYLVGQGGIISVYDCPPPLYSQDVNASYSSGICDGSGNQLTFYYNNISIGLGSTFYLDSNLTSLYTGQNGPYVRMYFDAQYNVVYIDPVNGQIIQIVYNCQ